MERRFFVIILFGTILCQKTIFAGTLRSVPNIARIRDGRPAEPRQFPWQVTLQSQYSDKNSTYCSGIIISNTWILTAAHCISGADNVTIGFGSINWSTPEMVINSKVFIINPDYKSSKRNDIALVSSVTPVRFTENIQPILLPRLDQTELTFVGVKARNSGWGADSNDESLPGQELKWADINVISNSDCSQEWGTIVTDSVICARGGSVCGSDFGGPLAYREEEGWILIGLTSFHQGCQSTASIGFSRITSHLQWICKETGIDISL